MQVWQLLLISPLSTGWRGPLKTAAPRPPYLGLLSVLRGTSAMTGQQDKLFMRGVPVGCQPSWRKIF